MRKSISQLITEASSAFADNVTGNITPAELRNWAIDFLNAISPAYGVLRQPGPNTQTFGLAPALVVFASAQDSDPSQTTTVVPGSTVTRTEPGTATINFTADIECAQNRFVTFTLYENGVATAWRQTANGGGTGNPVSVSFTAVQYIGTPGAVYDVRATAEQNGVSAIVSNAGLVVALDPVRIFT